jgi:hypothetical protein
MRTMKRKAGATWKRGAFLTYVAATGLEEATNPVAATKVVGMAAHEVPLANPKADDLTTAMVIMADEDTLFAVDTESLTLADTMVSQAFDLKKAANGNWMLDIVTAPGAALAGILIQLDSRDQPPLRIGPDPTPPVRRALIKLNPASRVLGSGG